MDTDQLRPGESLGPSARAQISDSLQGGPALSWAAVWAGAAAAASLSLILLVLGMGLGFSSLSPWANEGASATTLGVGTIVWILAVAAVASGIGGYLAGRLRTKWPGVHTDEVYFRDTAHGFLAWSVATLITAVALTSTIGSIVGTGVQAGGAAAGAVGTAVAGARTAKMSDASSVVGGRSETTSYFTDSLFRQASPSAADSASRAGTTSGSSSGSTTAEAGRIMTRSLSNGTLAPDDAKYLSQLVSQKTGLSPADADKRVTDAYSKAQQALQDVEAKAKDAADKARKAAAYVSLWIFVSLLLGAFAASLMATFGGRQRDR